VSPRVEPNLPRTSRNVPYVIVRTIITYAVPRFCGRVTDQPDSLRFPHTHERRPTLTVAVGRLSHISSGSLELAGPHRGCAPIPGWNHSSRWRNRRTTRIVDRCALISGRSVESHQCRRPVRSGLRNLCSTADIQPSPRRRKRPNNDRKYPKNRRFSQCELESNQWHNHHRAHGTARMRLFSYRN
jgi:hypothetical protein